MELNYFPTNLKKTSNGHFEQEFNFGDQKLPGKLIYPQENDPSKPTTYLFTFTDKLNPLDIAAIQETLQKNPHQLGNTIIVQMQTPTEPLKLNGKAVPLLKTITDDLKRYQGLPELSKLQQASKLLAVTDPEKSAEINKLLEEYNQSMTSGDPEAAKQASTYAELAEKIAEISEPEEEKIDRKSRLFKSGRRQKSSKKTSGGGGGSVSNPASSIDNSTTPSSSPTQAVSYSAGIPESRESNENEPIQGYVGFFGDSNLEAFSNPKRFLNLRDGGKGYAIRGHNTLQLMNQQMGIDQNGNPKNGKDLITDLDKMEKVVINCGLNDVFSNMTVAEIQKNLKTIVNYFLKKGKKVYLTTLSPFGGYQSNLFKLDDKRHGQSFEERRLAINNFILSDLKSLSGLKIIPVHLTKPEGGVASGQKDQYGNDTLDSNINSGDKLHFKPAEFSKLLGRYLREGDPNTSSIATKENPATKPQSTPVLTGQDAYWSKNVYGAPKGFSGGSVSQAAAIRSRQILNQGGMKAGEYKEETIDGVTYAFMHEGHPKSPSDHSSWHPSISVYVKKDKKPSNKDNIEGDSKTT